MSSEESSEESEAPLSFEGLLAAKYDDKTRVWKGEKCTHVCSWQGRVLSVQVVGEKVCFGWQRDGLVREQRRALEVFSQVWKDQTPTFLASIVDSRSRKDRWRAYDPV